MHTRRDFFRVATGAALAAVGCGRKEQPTCEPVATSPTSETLVKRLHATLTEEQRRVICFPWDYVDPARGLLRTHICNSWRITPWMIKSEHYSAEQQVLIREIFEGLVNPAWLERFDRAFADDVGGFGTRQAIALFGDPNNGLFEFVLTGRHGTFRCDGNSAAHVAFAGPILYGHAPQGSFSLPHHPGDVFWEQALEANKIYQMMDGKQQAAALLPEAPDEGEVHLRGNRGGFEGLPVSELSPDQREQLRKTVAKLIEPFRRGDQDEVLTALGAQGGLKRCHLAFYRRDALAEGVWDNWRLEGPAFVWHWRGSPHTHVWVHVADSPEVALNVQNDSWPLRKE